MCFVRPKNQWLCPALGLATRLASPCEHEACSISSQVSAAKTVNHFMKLCGLTLTYFCIVQTAAVMLVQASEDKECAHVSVCARSKKACWALRAQPIQVAWFEDFSDALFQQRFRMKGMVLCSLFRTCCQLLLFGSVVHAPFSKGLCF